MLDDELQGFVLGQVVLDARESRLLPVQRHLPPRVSVENGARCRREERLSNRPSLLDHTAHSGRGDRPTPRLIGRMGPHRRGGAVHHSTAFGATLPAVNNLVAAVGPNRHLATSAWLPFWWASRAAHSCRRRKKPEALRAMRRASQA